MVNETSAKRSLIIGIAGGTGSGKSTVSKAIMDSIPERSEQ